ncbi:MAG TPA: hypothetical protein VML54_03145 [Candidatus Limnocylindrales bacterium]|nr:hypothetical protein [Candidatus Limnocylindrales bacterium]
MVVEQSIRDYPEREQKDVLKRLVAWGLTAGQTGGLDLGYIALPDEVSVEGTRRAGAFFRDLERPAAVNRIEFEQMGRDPDAALGRQTGARSDKADTNGILES